MAAKDVEEGFSSKAEQPLLFNKILPDSNALDTAHCDGLGLDSSKSASMSETSPSDE